NTQFNPAADLNGDGLVNNSDLIRLHDRLTAVGASAATLAAYQNLLGPPTAGFRIAEGQTLSLTANQPSGTQPALSFSWDLNNDAVFGDATGAGTSVTWNHLQALGITDNGS